MSHNFHTAHDEHKVQLMTFISQSKWSNIATYHSYAYLSFLSPPPAIPPICSINWCFQHSKSSFVPPINLFNWSQYHGQQHLERMESDNSAKHLSGDILTELYINKTFMLVSPLPCQIQTPEWLCHFFAHFLTLCGGVYIYIYLLYFLLCFCSQSVHFTCLTSTTPNESWF